MKTENASPNAIPFNAPWGSDIAVTSDYCAVDTLNMRRMAAGRRLLMLLIRQAASKSLGNYSSGDPQIGSPSASSVAKYGMPSSENHIPAAGSPFGCLIAMDGFRAAQHHAGLQVVLIVQHHERHVGIICEPEECAYLASLALQNEARLVFGGGYLREALAICVEHLEERRSTLLQGVGCPRALPAVSQKESMGMDSLTLRARRAPSSWPPLRASIGTSSTIRNVPRNLPVESRTATEGSPSWFARTSARIVPLESYMAIP